MLCVYDLYDLHSILVRIRSSPCNEMNKEIVVKVIDVLKNRECNNDVNQFILKLKSYQKRGQLKLE